MDLNGYQNVPGIKLLAFILITDKVLSGFTRGGTKVKNTDYRRNSSLRIGRKNIKALNHKGAKTTREKRFFVLFVVPFLPGPFAATSKSDICSEKWIPAFITHGGAV